MVGWEGGRQEKSCPGCILDIFGYNKFVLIKYRGGDSISPIKTPKCSFLRTDMQCGFIKILRMKRGPSNFKMIVAS